jgi:CRISPR-associated endoribonuclease Cas6
VSQLVSLVVKVQPPETLTLPSHTGRAVHALLLRWLDAHSATLARRWHDSDGPKPYTCSSLIGGKPTHNKAIELTPDGEYWFRVTALIDEVGEVLKQRVQHPPQSVDIDGIILNVTETILDSETHHGAGCTSYDELASPYLMAKADAPRRLTLRFHAPTMFRQNDLMTPMVTPDLVFGSLADRWNAFSEIAINDQVREFARLSVGMSRFRIHSEGIPMMKQGIMIGSVGSVTYIGVNYDRYWMSMLGLLAEFSFYAGVGRLTTSGMGQARMIT